MSNEKTTEASEVELTDQELEGAEGGASTFKFFRPDPSKWKVNGFDGKGNDVVEPDMNVTQKLKF